MVERYVKDNKFGVLISYGYGAGWSTWNYKEIAIDKRVIEYFIEYKDNKDLDVFKKRINNLYKNVYFGGVRGLELEWVNVGTLIKITEYDGFEELHFNESDEEWF